MHASGLVTDQDMEDDESTQISYEYASGARQRRLSSGSRNRNSSSGRKHRSSDSFDDDDERGDTAAFDLSAALGAGGGLEGVNPELLALVARHARLEIPLIVQRRGRGWDNEREDRASDNDDDDDDVGREGEGLAPHGNRPSSAPLRRSSQKASLQTVDAAGGRGGPQTATHGAASSGGSAAPPPPKSSGGGGGRGGGVDGQRRSSSAGGSRGALTILAAGRGVDRSPDRMVSVPPRHGSSPGGTTRRSLPGGAQDRPWSPAGHPAVGVALLEQRVLREAKVGYDDALMSLSEEFYFDLAC